MPAADAGVQSSQLEAAVGSGPKLIYLLPNFQNPSDLTLSLERRRAVVALADRYGIPIIEDDPCGQLRYEGSHLPPLLVLDRAARGMRCDNGCNNGMSFT